MSAARSIHFIVLLLRSICVLRSICMVEGINIAIVHSTAICILLRNTEIKWVIHLYLFLIANSPMQEKARVKLVGNGKVHHVVYSSFSSWSQSNSWLYKWFRLLWRSNCNTVDSSIKVIFFITKFLIIGVQTEVVIVRNFSRRVFLHAAILAANFLPNSLAPTSSSDPLPSVDNASIPNYIVTIWDSTWWKCEVIISYKIRTFRDQFGEFHWIFQCFFWNTQHFGHCYMKVHGENRSSYFRHNSYIHWCSELYVA